MHCKWAKVRPSFSHSIPADFPPILDARWKNKDNPKRDQIYSSSMLPSCCVVRYFRWRLPSCGKSNFDHGNGNALFSASNLDGRLPSYRNSPFLCPDEVERKSCQCERVEQKPIEQKCRLHFGFCKNTMNGMTEVGLGFLKRHSVVRE